MSLRTADYDYELPEDLIASRPLPGRDDSRLLVLERATGKVQHLAFRDFPTFLREGDLCVLNNTRVVPARFFSEDGRVELLRLSEPEPRVWHCLAKPGRRLKTGASLTVAGVRGQVESVLPDGSRMIRWSGTIDPEQHGRLALPPYMHREQEEADRERYQTVYAAVDGSVAAPTAGLHFTADLLRTLPHVFVTLHVGVGTFRPVKAERLDEHAMHPEVFSVTEEAAAAIRCSRRVLAVGTTTVRVLEHLAASSGGVTAGDGETSIFIRPPYDFRVTGALLTNFHLPKSTLLMLVSAFAGREAVLEAYRQAVRLRYRFFSYGDAMLIV